MGNFAYPQKGAFQPVKSAIVRHLLATDKRIKKRWKVPITFPEDNWDFSWLGKVQKEQGHFAYKIAGIPACITFAAKLLSDGYFANLF